MWLIVLLVIKIMCFGAAHRPTVAIRHVLVSGIMTWFEGVSFLTLFLLTSASGGNESER